MSDVQYVEEGEDDALTMHPQSYAEMRYRTRDRLPKWAKRAINSVTAFFKKDPVATYILNDGPMTWYWNWLTKRCPPTHQLVNPDHHCISLQACQLQACHSTVAQKSLFQGHPARVIAFAEAARGWDSGRQTSTRTK